MKDMDSFTKAFFVAALWTSTDDKGNPFDQNYDLEDIAPETVEQLSQDCSKFQSENSQLMQGLSSSRCGHDFWLSRCGHGSGFFDEDSFPEEVKDKLQKASHEFGNVDLYVGDDGKIYC